MMRYIFAGLMAMLFCFPFISFIHCQDLKDKDEVNIAFIFDGEKDEFVRLAQLIQEETKSIIGSRYDIDFDKTRNFFSDWSSEMIAMNIQQAFSQNDIDILIGIGPVTSHMLAVSAPHTKPVIALGIFHPEFQKLPLTDDNTSGAKNLTYLQFPYSIERDIHLLSEIAPFQNLGIISDSYLLEVDSSAYKFMDKIAGGMDFNYKIISLDDIRDESLKDSHLELFDAIYYGPLYQYSNDDLSKLYHTVNALKKVSFSMAGPEHVKLGAYASALSTDDYLKIARRTAINLDKIIDGKKLSKMSVLLDFDENLMFNMQTIREVDIYPDRDILSEAQVINNTIDENFKLITLHTSIAKALEQNLEYKISQNELEIGRQDIQLARANLLPSIDASLLGVKVDKKSANASLGMNPENSLKGNLELSQVLFSEQAFANVKIQQYLQKSREHKHHTEYLDIILQAAQTYLNVLMVETLEDIMKENLYRSKRNLELARMRTAVGFTAATDVNRWEAQIANDKMEFLNAQAKVQAAKYALNQVMHNPLDDMFQTAEISIDSLNDYFNIGFLKDYMKNPKTSALLNRFFVKTALENLPELKQMEAAIEAQNRYVQSSKNRFYAPTIALRAQSGYYISRMGDGSSFDFPSEIPVQDINAPENQIGLIPIGDIDIDLQDLSWNTAISVNIPLSTGGERKANLQKNRLELQKLETQKELITERLSQQVKTYYEQFSISEPKLKLSRQSVIAARKNFNIIQEYYLKGLATIADVIDAQNATIQTEINASNAIYNYLSIILQLNRSIGIYYFLLDENQKGDFTKELQAYIEANN